METLNYVNSQGFRVTVTIGYPDRPEEWEGEFHSYADLFKRWNDKNYACFGFKGKHSNESSDDYI